METDNMSKVMGARTKVSGALRSADARVRIIPHIPVFTESPNAMVLSPTFTLIGHPLITLTGAADLPYGEYVEQEEDVTGEEGPAHLVHEQEG